MLHTGKYKIIYMIHSTALALLMFHHMSRAYPTYQKKLYIHTKYTYEPRKRKSMTEL